MKQSCIPSAGLGLFALESFVAGDVICEYTGSQLRTIEALRQDTVPNTVRHCTSTLNRYSHKKACVLVFPTRGCVKINLCFCFTERMDAQTNLLYIIERTTGVSEKTKTLKPHDPNSVTQTGVGAI